MCVEVGERVFVSVGVSLPDKVVVGVVVTEGDKVAVGVTEGVLVGVRDNDIV